MVMTFIMMLVVAICAAIFRSEFEAWMPWLAERLRRLALRPLQGNLRDRLDEEWASHLAETPGFVGKVLTALGFNWASRQISLRQSLYRFGFFLSAKAMRTLHAISKLLMGLSGGVAGLALPVSVRDPLSDVLGNFGLELMFFAVWVACWRSCLIADPVERERYEQKRLEALTVLNGKLEEIYSRAETERSEA